MIDLAARVERVSHAFPGIERDQLVLDDINLHVKVGDFVALVGPSGCGKTTLLKMFAGLERPSEGSVSIGGSEPRVGSESVAVLFARDQLLPWRTARENVSLALELRGDKKKTRLTAADEMLANVGLKGFERHYPAELSQGMRQRVAIARTLVPQPSLVLMDEPFSALDAQTRLQMHALLLEISSDRTVVFITHDLSEAITLADRIALMSARPGRLKRIYDVPFERPRLVTELQASQEYHDIYRTIWTDLEEEFNIHGTDET